MLNHFGHCISYSQVLELETAMAEQQLGQQRDDVLLPSCIIPGVFATLAWDNNDLQEETLSGKGTTHCTNGIIVQRTVDTCEPPPSKPKRLKITRRSLDVQPSQVIINFKIMNNFKIKFTNQLRYLNDNSSVCFSCGYTFICTISADILAEC